MKIQTQAAKVLERTSHYLKAGVVRDTPAWYNVVLAVPPAVDLTRKPTLLLTNQEADPASKLGLKSASGYKTRFTNAELRQKNSTLTKIPKLAFLEDELRDVFYHQHPWEFARPKVLVENLGNDNAKCDWLHMLQLHRPLDGESVVQRTMWLLEHQPPNLEHTKEEQLFAAYDQARFEFYQLRMAEETGSAVAREELELFGATFYSTYLAHGVAQEQGIIDEWAVEAEERTKVKDAARNKASASVGSEAAPETNMWEQSADEMPEIEEN